MQTIRKKPQRTCLGCRNSKDKTELVRIVRTPEGEVVVDRTGKKNGRGAYICPDPECLRLAMRSKALGKALSTEIPEEIYEILTAEIRHGE
ncbi:MAG: YlxR family protein [Lachnospiraceae bacterium]|jgi:predicted RNA-binding protein YlxR (DUF448 family)|nr:YlxR family protein [Lachnospiraceae bacterium]MBR7015843.1 YlxR family protein [Lachnospiraceae bacterium]MEE3377001.1 YlxR family protein [Lachnospiraceae bacterium]MEE3457202.1 YlxR family protein [Lachnospiraceae bacterium]